MDSTQALKRLIAKSKIEADSETASRLLEYLVLLEKWNAQINLTSSTDWSVLGPLFQEGIWASGRYLQNASSHLDIGSGAGFPALLLGIFNPHVGMDLVESRLKKSVFLETAASALGLEKVKVHTARLQEYLRGEGQGRIWDCISWKALRLSDKDLEELRVHAHAATQFWMFHGQDLAVEDPESMERHFRLLNRERFAVQKQWVLSIYTRNEGSARST